MSFAVGVRFRILLFAVVVASALGCGGQVASNYTKESVAELIDDLTQIDSESVLINGHYVRAGFIAEETPASLRTYRDGIAIPDAQPQLRELVRRGPLALPELIKHLDDKRPTKLEVGIPLPGTAFYGKFFGYEYSARVRDWEQTGARWGQKSFWGTHTLKVGDICYALIGQIVNRPLLVERGQPTGFLVVNSPIEAPVLVSNVRDDWGKGDAETLKASLLADIDGVSHLADIKFGAGDTEQFREARYVELVVNPALQRLRAYFPDAYNSLSGDGLQRKVEFQKQESVQRSPSA